MKRSKDHCPECGKRLELLGFGAYLERFEEHRSFLSESAPGGKGFTKEELEEATREAEEAPVRYCGATGCVLVICESCGRPHAIRERYWEFIPFRIFPRRRTKTVERCRFCEAMLRTGVDEGFFVVHHVRNS